MNPTLPDEALELRTAAAKAFDALGGVDLARRAEADPGVRAAEVARVLMSLGVADLDPRSGIVELAAAAALCDAAGRVALPYPLAASLVRDGDGRPTAPGLRVDHGDLFEAWATDHGTAGATGPPLGTRLGPWVTDLAIAGGPPAPARDLDLQSLLTSWTILGTAERAVALAVEHTNGRVQFGQPISAFQAVRFQLADAAVAVAGLRELAAYTLWCRQRADVLALRLHALEVARGVLRTCQQLHGAAGVCDEYDVSILTRLVQPALRLPQGADATADLLASVIEAEGFDGLFPHGAQR